MALDIGSTLPGDYRLTEKLDSVGWYIHTWRAHDARGQEMIVKLHCTVVSDDYPGINDLRDKIEPLLPRIDRLVAAPAVRGLAPWLSYSYDPNGGYLFLVRRYYAARLDETFSPRSDTPGG